MKDEIKIYPDQLSLAESLADEIAGLAGSHSAGQKPFTIALSGGKTPDILFSLLGKKYGDCNLWKNVHFFWVDERCVPAEDEASNYRSAKELFLSKAGICVQNIHRIIGENDPDYEAVRYSEEILENTVLKNGKPSFDLILLGLGEDGHTASVFPGNEILFQSERICESAVHPQTGQRRVTITGTVINNAKKIFFLTAGINKAEVIYRILGKDITFKQFPASLVRPGNGQVIWFLDRDAASLL